MVTSEGECYGGKSFVSERVMTKASGAARALTAKELRRQLRQRDSKIRDIITIYFSLTSVLAFGKLLMHRGWLPKRVCY